jgi:hypothetical protein
MRRFALFFAVSLLLVTSFADSKLDNEIYCSHHLLSLVPLLRNLDTSAEKGLFMPILNNLPKIESRLKNLVKPCGLPALQAIETHNATTEQCISIIKHINAIVSEIFTKPTNLEQLKAIFKNIHAEFPTLLSICQNINYTYPIDPSDDDPNEVNYDNPNNNNNNHNPHEN